MSQPLVQYIIDLKRMTFFTRLLREKAQFSRAVRDKRDPTTCPFGQSRRGLCLARGKRVKKT